MSSVILLAALAFGQAGTPAEMAELEAMTREYVALGMPLPSDDAVLVESGWPVYLSERRDAQGHRSCPGALEPGWVHALDDELRPITRPSQLVEAVHVFEDRDLDAGPAFAVIEYRRNHLDNALALLRDRAHFPSRYEEGEFAENRLIGGLIASKHDTLVERVRKLAFTREALRLTEPNASLAPILARLTTLAKLRPAMATKSVNRLIDSIDHTIHDRYHGFDTVEQKIDRLIDDKGTPSTRSTFGATEIGAELRGDLTVVPALIDHIDDDRLTRNVFQSPYSGWVRETVGDHCRELLIAYGVEREPAPSKVELRRWWASIVASGPRTYFVGLAKSYKTYSQDNFAPVVRNWPDALPNLLESSLVGESSSQFKACLNAYRLTRPPARTVARYLIRACRRWPIDLSLFIEDLAKLDRPAAESEVVERLSHFPTQAKDAGEAERLGEISRGVSDMNTTATWAALSKALDRAEPKLRLAMLKPLTVGKNAVHLAFLRPYLDDAATTDADRSPTVGPVPSVGAALAQALSFWIDVKEPQPQAPRAEWEAHRRQVAKQVDRLLERKPRSQR